MVIDGLIAPLAAEPAVPATNLLDSLADQLTRLRRRAGEDRAATPPALGGRVAAASGGIAVGRLSCSPEEVGAANSSWPRTASSPPR
jgi:hypothetical protein